MAWRVVAGFGAALAALVGAPAVAHDATQCCDEHRYLATAGDLFAGCKLDEDHGGALPFHGLGGACFDVGIDLKSGTQISVEIIDDVWGRQVGGVIRFVSYNNQVLQPNTPFCGEYPEGGGFAPLPLGAVRIAVFPQPANSVVNCLAFGELGFPPTTGVIRVCTQ